jgi:High potential iron-sulfur protein
MQIKLSRRAMVKCGLIAGTLVPTLALIGTAARAAELPPLDPSDPTAKALDFTADATKVDSSAAPTYKAGAKCSTCAQFLGKPRDASAPCTIFPGHSVPAGGWCKVWQSKGS